MKLSRQDLLLEAEDTKFRPEFLEKVIHLLDLLNALQRHPFLKERIVLKGGSALNLFLFDLPRLSVDIDLNYIGSPDRDTMQAERPVLEEAFRAVFLRKEFTVHRAPAEHAGGKWRLGFQSALGQRGHLAVDINFILRVPLWPPTTVDSKDLGTYNASGIRLLDLHELAAGKLSALLTRGAARDLFDAHQLLGRDDLDREQLRLALTVYGGFTRKDWRTVSADDLVLEANDLHNQLLPLLHERSRPHSADVNAWALQLLEECRERLGVVLPFEPHQREFLDRLLDHGELAPEALTSDEALAERIRLHPALRWKALNVRKHKGIT